MRERFVPRLEVTNLVGAIASSSEWPILWPGERLKLPRSDGWRRNRAHELEQVASYAEAPE